MSVEKGYVGGYDEKRSQPATTHDLRQAVRDYISECDNPVPDYSYRRVLRNRMRELAGAPPEPKKLT